MARRHALQSPPGGPAVERALCVAAGAAVAAEIADRAGDPTLAVRVGIIDGYRGVLAGEDDARNKILPLARAGPLLVRARISLRCDGPGVDSIDEAWRLLRGFGEPLRLFAAAVIAERAWLSGTPDDRLDECRTLLPTAPLTAGNGRAVSWRCG